MWNPFRRPVDPTDQDRQLARQLLATAQRLLGSTSSVPSTATPWRSARPLPPDYRKRTAEDVTISTRARHLEQEWEARRALLPKPVRDPSPVSPDQQSSGKAVSGGFAPTTADSLATAADPGSDTAP